MPRFRQSASAPSHVYTTLFLSSLYVASPKRKDGSIVYRTPTYLLPLVAPNLTPVTSLREIFNLWVMTLSLWFSPFTDLPESPFPSSFTKLLFNSSNTTTFLFSGFADSSSKSVRIFSFTPPLESDVPFRSASIVYTPSSLNLYRIISPLMSFSKSLPSFFTFHTILSRFSALPSFCLTVKIKVSPGLRNVVFPFAEPLVAPGIYA